MIRAGYVKANTGAWAVQLPDDTNPWGFTLHTDDLEFPGGFGFASEFALVDESQVPEPVRRELGDLLVLFREAQR